TGARDVVRHARRDGLGGVGQDEGGEALVGAEAELLDVLAAGVERGRELAGDGLAGLGGLGEGVAAGALAEDVEEAELAALEERVLVAEGLVRGLVAVAEVGVLADGGGGEVEREDVVAAGEDDAAAVGREARVGLGLAGGGEPAE